MVFLLNYKLESTLLHVSEMSWSTHLRSANDFYKKGDTVKAQVLTLDKENRKMSLGVKQMTPDPWQYCC